MRDGSILQPNRYEREDLREIVGHIEEEARMVVPGIQALFGFQLIAIFNQRFSELSAADQKLHLAALFCSAFAVLFVLAPAAYHRLAEPQEVSSYFCRFATRCLSIGLFPLALGISIDLFIIANVVLHSRVQAMGAAAGVFILYLLFWFIFPVARKRTRASPR